jgi:hypothetical protein
MAVDRELLAKAEQALKTNSPMDEETRKYAEKVLRTVNQLVFYGVDIERIYELEVHKKRGAKTAQALREFRILSLAHQKERGMEEARKYVQAKREGKNIIVAEVAFIQAIEGVTQTKALKILAELSGRDYEGLKSMYCREKKRLGR